MKKLLFAALLSLSATCLFAGGMDKDTNKKVQDDVDQNAQMNLDDQASSNWWGGYGGWGGYYGGYGLGYYGLGYGGWGGWGGYGWY